jgi:hypothetical protein
MRRVLGTLPLLGALFQRAVTLVPSLLAPTPAAREDQKEQLVYPSPRSALYRGPTCRYIRQIRLEDSAHDGTSLRPIPLRNTKEGDIP